MQTSRPQNKLTLRDAIISNDIAQINKFTINDFCKFVDDEYKNVFLLAARFSQVETVKAILNIISKHPELVNFNIFIRSRDRYDRSAMMLAAIADNSHLLCYLNNELNLPTSEYNKYYQSALSHAIERNSFHAFCCLLFDHNSFGHLEEALILGNKKFQLFFNSPECFLPIIRSGNIAAFQFIMRHIRTQSDDRKKEFFTVRDEDGRNALIIAITSNHNFITPSLMELEFNLEDRDKYDKTALSYLIEQKQYSLASTLLDKTKRIFPDEAKQVAGSIHSLISNTKKSRNAFANSSTFSPDNMKQPGRLPKATPVEIRRPYRTFAHERERQLLRQASTQLYFFIENFLSEYKLDEKTTHNQQQKINGKIVEVQTMHLDFGGDHSLFIAVNEHAVSKHFGSMIQNKEHFNQILSQPHTLNRDIEGNVRSQRYAKKLKTRVFDTESTPPAAHHESDAKQASQVARLLREGEIYPLPIGVVSSNKTNTLSGNTVDLLRHCIRNLKNKIYLVYVNECPGPLELRHAEEFLSDIADSAKALGKETGKEVYTSIGGKKRPCMGCSGRLRGSITQYSTFPGRLWVTTIENQPHHVALQTADVILSNSAHITVSRNGTQVRDYDSGSDSELEETRHGLAGKIGR